jgi:hypothetical protein
MRVWALASYGSILALTACSAQKTAATTPEVDPPMAGNDTLTVDGGATLSLQGSRPVSEPEVPQLVSAPHLAPALELTASPPLTPAPQLTRPPLSVPHPPPSRSTDLRTRLNRLRAQHSPVQDIPAPSLENSNAAHKPLPTDNSGNAVPPRTPGTIQPVITVPDRPVPADPQPDIATVSVQPLESSAPLALGTSAPLSAPGDVPLGEASQLYPLTRRQLPQSPADFRPIHHSYSTQRLGSPPNLTPTTPPLAAAEVDLVATNSSKTHVATSQSGHGPSNVIALADDGVEDDYFHDHPPVGRADGESVDVPRELPAHGEGSSPATGLDAPNALPPVVAGHAHHRTTEVSVSLSPAGHGTPQLHLPTEQAGPRFSTPPASADEIIPAQVGEAAPTTADPTTAAPLPGNREPALTAVGSREASSPLPLKPNLSPPLRAEAHLPEAGISSSAYPESLPLHHGTTVINAPASPPELESPIPANPLSASPAPEVGLTEGCDPLAIASPTDHAPLAQDNPQWAATSASNAKLCAGDTNPLAHNIPEAATAGTPIPGRVESPTR